MNPIASGWCRQCGVKLVFDPAAVQAAVAMADRAGGDRRWFQRGLEWLPLGVFVLVMGAIVRLSSPGLPPVEPPVVGWPPLLPTPVATTVQAAPVSTAAAPAAAGSVLDWRMAHGAAVLGDLGLDIGALDLRAATVAAAQGRDGGWGGPGPTALATLALQAHPIPTVQVAAARGRAWLLARQSEWPRWPSPVRAMTCLALAEAGLLPAADIRRLEILLVDGRAGSWQPLLLAHLAPGEAPLEWAGLDSGDILLPLVARRHGRSGAGEAPRDRIVVQALDAPTTTGGRLATALAAWTSGDEPRSLAGWLRDAARLPAPTADLPPEPWAAAAGSVLIGTAPIRLPAGWSVAGPR
jgi:hypothetical protein